MTKLQLLRLSKTPLDRVNIKLGRTINLGDFESYRIDVEYESCVMPEETLPEAMKRVTSVTAHDLKAKVAKVRSQLLKVDE